MVYGLHFQNKHLVCHFQSRLDKLGSCCCVAPFRSDLGSQIRSWISCVLLSALSKILRKSPPILASEVSLMRTSDSLITRFLFPVSPTSYTWYLVPGSTLKDLDFVLFSMHSVKSRGNFSMDNLDRKWWSLGGSRRYCAFISYL